MHKYIFLVFFTLAIFNANGQNLTSNSCGVIYDSNMQKLSPEQVKELFKVDNNILNQYKKGREKKTLGNVLLWGGLGLMTLDLGAGFYSGTGYPSVVTFVGAGAVLVSIPVKLGFSRKIKKSVEDYNKLNPVSYGQVSKREFRFTAGPNGFGIKFTLD
jgi:hypothetical protein